MSLVRPFRGMHYNAAVVGSLDAVLSPPYDVISPEEQEKLFSKSAYNFARLIMPTPGDEKYQAAAKRLAEWRAKEILILDRTESFYLYQQFFTAGGKTHRRNTLLASVMLHDFSEGVVRPHENTHGKYKADRLEILRATKANLSPIFMMVKDREAVLATLFEEWMYHQPLLSGTLDGVENRVWRIEKAAFSQIENFFNREPLYIVDGHHRYESALMYARENQALGSTTNPAGSLMVAIANVYDQALVVWPTHRWVRSADYTKLSKSSVEKKFRLTKSNWDALEKLSRTPEKLPVFGVYGWGECYIAEPLSDHLSLPGGSKALSKLAVAWSDNELLGDLLGIKEDERSKYIRYEKNVGTLRESAQMTDFAVIHAPPRIEDVTEVSDQNGFMPQKSTFFIPKLASGLLIRPHV